MKYALKPSSRVIDVKGSNKIIYFNDEKSLVNFFIVQMRKDLNDPIEYNERLDRWQLQYWIKRHGNYAGVSKNDLIGVFSYLVNCNLDLPFLSWSARVSKIIRQDIGMKSAWSIVGRLRSLPCNYSLYTMCEHEGGYVLNNVRWGPFWRMADKQKLFDGISLAYKLPEGGE